MKEKVESVKSVSKTLLVVLVLVFLTYSKGIYERTILIKNTELREILVPMSAKWHETMQSIYVASIFDFLRNTFSTFTEPSYTISKQPDTIIPIAKYSAQNPLKTLLVGDSMAMILGYSFTQEFTKKECIEFTVDARASTSLSLPEYFNWPSRFEKIVSEKHFDLIIIHIGANDAQAIRAEGKYLKFGTDEWKDVYKKRIHEFIQIAKKQKGKVYWIGLPPMQNRYFHIETSLLNELAELICKEENITFISTYPVLGDTNWNFTKVKEYNQRPVIIRSEDGIHANGYGSILMRDAINVYIKKDFVFEDIQIELPK